MACSYNLALLSYFKYTHGINDIVHTHNENGKQREKERQAGRQTEDRQIHLIGVYGISMITHTET